MSETPPSTRSQPVDAAHPSGSNAASLEGLVLERLGWDRSFAAAFEPHEAAGLVPGRVAIEHRNRYAVYTAAGEITAQLPGRLRQDLAEPVRLPAVGDWVALRTHPDGMALIQAVLPRRSAFVRKAAGREELGQVLAANVDTVFVVSAAADDLNPRRLERYLTLAWESGASPVVVVTKADLISDPDESVRAVGAAAIGVAVHVVSNITGQGLEELRGYLTPGRTVALLGSSGVGKSTLVNRLMGRDVLDTAEVRARDGKGRHTTTRRQLVALPDGGLVIDTPGMRELALWHAADGLRGAFEDVVRLALCCRFADCRHGREPHCAVRAAVEAGELPAERFESYHKLRRELERLERRGDRLAAAEQKRKIKAIQKSYRAHFRER